MPISPSVLFSIKLTNGVNGLNLRMNERWLLNFGWFPFSTSGNEVGSMRNMNTFSGFQCFLPILDGFSDYFSDFLSFEDFTLFDMFTSVEGSS